MAILNDWKCPQCGFFEAFEPLCPSCGNTEVMKVILTPPHVITSSSPTAMFGEDEFKHDYVSAKTDKQTNDVISNAFTEVEHMVPNKGAAEMIFNSGFNTLQSYGINATPADLMNKASGSGTANPLLNMIERRTGRDLLREERYRKETVERIKHAQYS